jgi:hypothetical protein
LFRNCLKYEVDVRAKNNQKKKLNRSQGPVSSTSLSRIGFNKDETEALVYRYWEAAGDYCGGEFVHLRKANNKWTVVKTLNTVIC